MNSLSGHISGIQVHEGLSIVTVNAGQGLELRSIVIDTPETAGYLVEGGQINVLFKETEAIIGAKGNHDISLQNRIEGKIEAIEKGVLLSKIIVGTLVGQLVAIISSNAVEQLKLSVGLEVVLMVKLNEIMLAE